MGKILDLISDVLETLNNNQYIFWVIVGCVGALVILVTLLIVLNVKSISVVLSSRKKNKEKHRK